MEFAYNRSMHQSIGRSPFEVVYGLKPIEPLDLAPHATSKQFSGDAEIKARKIKKLYEKVTLKIEKQKEKYFKQANMHRKFVEFQEGDLVWIHLRNDKFPQDKFGKLKPRVDDPFKILEKIRESTYKIDIFPTF